MSQALCAAPVQDFCSVSAALGRAEEECRTTVKTCPLLGRTTRKRGVGQKILGLPVSVVEVAVLGREDGNRRQHLDRSASAAGQRNGEGSPACLALARGRQQD